MKAKALFTTAACCAMIIPAFQAKAQDETVVVEETAIFTEVPCKTHYYVDKHDNWFLQLGAGTAVPFVEGTKVDGSRKSHFTVNYNVGFGRWFSPYMGWRLAFNGGPLHYQNHGMQRFNYVGANLDFMWDMFNSLGGVNSKRVFSIIPFVGLGGTFSWDFRGQGNILDKQGNIKSNQWTLPVSGGLQLRFRLCKYVDFLAEARASM